jgi:hypothetical protein
VVHVRTLTPVRKQRLSRTGRIILITVCTVVVLAAAFGGWMAYRQHQYDHRESVMLTRYKREYVTCVTHFTRALCRDIVGTKCANNKFWNHGEPFDPFDDAISDASDECLFGY